MYQRDTYNDLVRHEVIAPAVLNNGEHSGYPHLLGQALADAGFNWTSVHTTGCWNGKIEPGVQFTIFAAKMAFIDADRDPFYQPTAEIIGRIARKIMTDQDAIQVVVDAPITLIEA